MDEKLKKNTIKILDKNNLDYKNFIYFWDDNLDMYALNKETFFQKKIDIKDYYILDEVFYDTFSKSFFEYMFLDMSLDIPFFKFIILDLKDIADEKKSIITLIEEVLGRVAVLNLKKKIVIFYFNKESFNFKSIIDTINDDFAVVLKVFEGCKIINKSDFFTIFGFYNTYLNPSSHSYATISDLILTVQEIDHSKLKILRPIILNKIIDDFQLVNLINSLFDNNLNVTQTASIVYMHRNTINNKIEYIKNETGLNIQNFKEAVSMYLLIKEK